MSNSANLENVLDELFGQDVSLESGQHQQLGEAQLFVGEMSYQRTIHTENGHTVKHIRQTVLVSHDAELDLPEFSLSPKRKGLVAGLLSWMGGMSDIDFEDSPTFSEEYSLHGWAEKPVRLLFNPDTRAFFSQRLGWSVMGKGDALAIFRHNHVIEDAEEEEFTNVALEILAQFQQAEEQLDEVGVRRETTTGDVAATAERMGGLAGAMLLRQLRKIAISPEELEAFAAEAPPRTVPPGMKRQVLGDNAVLVYVGLFFLIGSIAFGVGIWWFDKEGKAPWFGYTVPVLQAVAGSAMVFFTARHRRRKFRTLTHGILAEGTVQEIEATQTVVNDQRQHKVVIEFSSGGTTTTKTFNAYGGSVDTARSRQKKGLPMRVLIDPQDSDHLVGLDVLVITNDQP